MIKVKICDVEKGERIIVLLDQHFAVYPEGAGVDEGAGLDKGDLFYTGVFYSGYPTPS